MSIACFSLLFFPVWILSGSCFRPNTHYSHNFASPTTRSGGFCGQPPPPAAVKPAGGAAATASARAAATTCAAAIHRVCHAAATLSMEQR